MPNYQTEMETTLAALPKGTPLLLHACCGPCASVALERLAPYLDITLYFYNPNIAPQQEYQRRLDALEQLLAQMPLPAPVKLISEPWQPQPFLQAAQGLEDAPEGGARCTACFDLRLARTTQKARQLGFAWFGTTLSTGPRKSAAALYQSGSAAAQREGLSFLPADFKKQNGYQRSIELCRQYGIYRQQYCGCAFSGPLQET